MHQITHTLTLFWFLCDPAYLPSHVSIHILWWPYINLYVHIYIVPYTWIKYIYVVVSIRLYLLHISSHSELHSTAGLGPPEENSCLNLLINKLKWNSNWNGETNFGRITFHFACISWWWMANYKCRMMKLKTGEAERVNWSDNTNGIYSRIYLCTYRLVYSARVCMQVERIVQMLVGNVALLFFISYCIILSLRLKHVQLFYLMCYRTLLKETSFARCSQNFAMLI